MAPSKMAAPTAPPQRGRRSYVTIACVVAAFAVVPTFLARTHLAPAFVDGAIPPYSLYWPLISLVSALDDVMRNLTPPNLYLWRHLMGHLHTSQLHVVAKLGIADALSTSDEPKSSLQLARELTPCAGVEDAAGPAGCDAVALRITRLLRATSAYGVFREAAPEAWVHTAPSRFLISAPAQPNSLRNSALLFGGTQYASLAHATHTIVTGQASFELAHGSEFWAYYEAHPDAHAIFDNTMREIGALGANDAAIAGDFSWPSIVGNGTVVDVGGGLGDMLSHVLLAHPSIPAGIIFDIPSVTARSEGVWRAAGEAGAAEEAGGARRLDGPTARRAALSRTGRVRFSEGSFFEPATIPSAVDAASSVSGGDASSVCAAPPMVYALRDIVHDWPDEDVVRMLSAIGTRMRAPSAEGSAVKCGTDRIALVARLVAPGAGFVSSQGTNDADFLMLVSGSCGPSNGACRYREPSPPIVTARLPSCPLSDPTPLTPPGYLATRPPLSFVPAG